MLFIRKGGYEPKVLRTVLSKGTLESLPKRYLSQNELWDEKILEQWSFNPSYYYEKEVNTEEKEIGHDSRHRYVMTD